MRERCADFVFLRLQLVRQLQVLDGNLGLAEPDVDQMTEVVVVPGVARRDVDRAAVTRDGRAEVAEQRLAQAHERVHAIVTQVGGDQLAQVQRRLPGRLFESQLRERGARQAYSLLAPIDRRVASLQAAPGSDVSPNVPVAMIIPEAGELEAHLLVPTRAAGLIEVGQRVEINYEAYPARVFGIKVAHIRSIDTAVLTPQAVQAPEQIEEPVYRVVARLDEQDVDAFGRSYPLQPGMSFEAEIGLETRSFMTWILEPLYSLSSGS